jgi:uncharacterized phage protein gp47/JayE
MPLLPVGFTPRSTTESLADIQQVFVNTFGSGVNLNPTSINGVFVQELTNDAIQVQSAQTLLYGGLYNPNIANGVFLDSICALLSIQRKAAVPSTVTCQLTGLPGTVIPALSQILNTNGDIFQSTTIITIGVDGTAIGTFQSIVSGIIPCVANTLNRIVQRIAGWDTVNNSTDGTTGTLVQSDLSLRYTRLNTLAINSVGTIESIISACEQNSNIIDYYVANNTKATPTTIGGVTVPAFGIYLSVYGGTLDEIAEILYKKKPPGTVMGGSTNYTYVDPIYTWVTFPATWQTAVETPVQVNISIATGSYPSDIVTQIKNAVVDNFNNGTATQPPVTMRIGSINAYRFAQTLNVLGIYNINSITVQTVTAGTPANSLTLSIDKAPTLIAANVLVSIP